jgi:hypothetical protein
MLGPIQNREPFFILSGGNQPSSNLEPAAHGQRSRDYVMFVQSGFNEVAHSAKITAQRRATSQNPPDSRAVSSASRSGCRS